MCVVPDDDIALILGGTRGLGLAIARTLPKLDWFQWPVVIGRTPPEESKGIGYIQADLTDPECADKIVSTLKERFVRRDDWPKTFYWVAGEYHRGPFAEQDPSKTASMLATHIAGPLAVLQAFHKEAILRKSPYTLVVVASVFVHKPGKKHAMLAAAKAFKANFARVFVHELAEDLPGSSVLLVNPWAIKTGFFDGYPMDPKAVESFMNSDDVARIICTEVEKIPKDAKPPMIELTLDRDKNVPGGILQLIGPQPVKY